MGPAEAHRQVLQAAHGAAKAQAAAAAQQAAAAAAAMGAKSMADTLMDARQRVWQHLLSLQAQQERADILRAMAAAGGGAGAGATAGLLLPGTPPVLVPAGLDVAMLLGLQDPGGMQPALNLGAVCAAPAAHWLQAGAAPADGAAAHSTLSLGGVPALLPPPMAAGAAAACQRQAALDFGVLHSLDSLRPQLCGTHVSALAAASPAGTTPPQPHMAAAGLPGLSCLAGFGASGGSVGLLGSGWPLHAEPGARPNVGLVGSGMVDGASPNFW